MERSECAAHPVERTAKRLEPAALAALQARIEHLEHQRCVDRWPENRASHIDHAWSQKNARELRSPLGTEPERRRPPLRLLQLQEPGSRLLAGGQTP